MKQLFIAAGLLVLALAGCSRPDQTPPVEPIVVQTEPLPRPGLNLPPVDEFRARPVEWMVITRENADEIFDQLEATGQPVVIFGVSENGYENIALNTSESLRVIIQQRAVIEGYERYYIEADGVIYEYNRSIQQ